MTQRRDFFDRQHVAKHVRHVRTHDRLCLRPDGRPEGLQRIVRVKELPPRDFHVRADLNKGPPDRVVLKARDDDLISC